MSRGGLGWLIGRSNFCVVLYGVSTMWSIGQNGQWLLEGGDRVTQDGADRGEYLHNTHNADSGLYNGKMNLHTSTASDEGFSRTSSYYENYNNWY